MRYFEKNPRSLDYIASKEQKQHVITKYLLDQELVLREDPFDKKFKVRKYIEDGEKIVVQALSGFPEADIKSLSFFKLLAKYIELDCQVSQKLENDLYLCKLDKVAIARSNREFSRVNVPNGKVFVTNIVSSKTIIEANMFNIPTLVKVNFEDYKTG